MKISERIFEIMKQKKITQLQLGKACGISQSVISDWKTKKTNPSANKILPICDFLEITPEELLRGAD